MPTRFAYIAYEDEFTVEESARLLRCVLPQDMAEKWIVLVDDHRRSFHRSWTGCCIYAVTLVSPDEAAPTHYCTCDALVNREPSQWAATDDALDVARLRWLVRTLLLHQELELPVDPAVPAEAALLDAWAFAGSVAFPGSVALPTPSPADDVPAPELERRPPSNDPPLLRGR